MKLYTDGKQSTCGHKYSQTVIHNFEFPVVFNDITIHSINVDRQTATAEMLC